VSAPAVDRHAVLGRRGNAVGVDRGGQGGGDEGVRGAGRWRNAGGQAVARDVSESESEVTLFISDLG
jgi:hypothetical protein